MGNNGSFPIVSLNERQVVVTGGNTGLGYEIAKWLAFLGADVVIACRSTDRGNQAIKQMQEEYVGMKDKLREEHGIESRDSLSITCLPLDLSSIASTIQFVDLYKQTGRKLHVLILNAGIGMAPYEQTDDGFEKMLQVNYLSHFIMAAKLLPVMRNSGKDCRLLLMSSDAHRSCGFDVNKMNYTGNPSSFGRLDYYGRSKLYQIMQMHCMARRLKGSNISVNSCHPGIVQTEISRNFQDSFFWNTIFFKGAKLFGQMKTPYEGALSMLNAAINPELEGVNGIYYTNCKDGYTTSTARNVEKQEALWRQTMELVSKHLTSEEIDSLEGDCCQATGAS